MRLRVLVHAARAAVGPEARQHGGGRSARDRSSWRWRWCRWASSARSSSRPVDRGEIFIQLTYPIGTPLRRSDDRPFALEREILDSAGHLRRYRRSRRVCRAIRRIRHPEQRRPGPHLAEGRPQAIDRAIGFASSGRSPTKTLPKGVQSVVVPATGTGGGNAQPLDVLVTDITGGDPTPYAQKVTRSAQKRARCNQRQQHRHSADTRDLDSVRSREGASAQR